MTPLIDIGANLTHDCFDADRDAVVDRAVSAGVTRMILTGSSVQASLDAVALAERLPDRFRATAGVHPHHAADYDDAAHATLAELAPRAAVVAIGECGLDYYRDFSPRVTQCAAFERQLELAINTGLPVFLHQRDAHEDFIAMLRPAMQHISRGVAHCFTGGIDELYAFLELGLYIGITGWICDERRGAQLYAAASRIPLDRLMIETDAPYLLPRTIRPRPKSRRNEPKYLPEVLRAVADAMDLTEEQVAAATTRNARQFFAI